MNWPQVKKLHYKMIFKEGVDYTNAPPIIAETEVFKMTASNDCVIFEMKQHFSEEHQAMRKADNFLKDWKVLIDINRQPDEIIFRYERAEIIELTPSVEDNVVQGFFRAKTGRMIANLSGEVSYKVSRATYIEPPKRIVVDKAFLTKVKMETLKANETIGYNTFQNPIAFTISPDVKTMHLRYVDYLQGRDKLLSMAYLFLTVLELSTANNRSEAARQYRISKKLLDRLGGYCSKGDYREARKAPRKGAFEPLTPKEKSWIEFACKAIIMRTGEYAALGSAEGLPQITMAELPSLN